MLSTTGTCYLKKKIKISNYKTELTCVNFVSLKKTKHKDFITHLVQSPLTQYTMAGEKQTDRHADRQRQRQSEKTDRHTISNHKNTIYNNFHKNTYHCLLSLCIISLKYFLHLPGPCLHTIIITIMQFTTVSSFFIMRLRHTILGRWPLSPPGSFNIPLLLSHHAACSPLLGCSHLFTLSYNYLFFQYSASSHASPYITDLTFPYSIILYYVLNSSLYYFMLFLPLTLVFGSWMATPSMDTVSSTFGVLLPSAFFSCWLNLSFRIPSFTTSIPLGWFTSVLPRNC